jgi:hypothetical protein
MLFRAERGTLRGLVENGRLHVYRPTERKVLFDRIELDALIQGSAVPGVSE